MTSTTSPGSTATSRGATPSCVHRSLFQFLWITGKVHAGGQLTALSTEIEKATDERQRWIRLRLTGWNQPRLTAWNQPSLTGCTPPGLSRWNPPW